MRSTSRDRVLAELRGRQMEIIRNAITDLERMRQDLAPRARSQVDGIIGRLRAALAEQAARPDSH